MNGDPIIAHVLFTDGAPRPVYMESTHHWGSKQMTRRMSTNLGADRRLPLAFRDHGAGVRKGQPKTATRYPSDGLGLNQCGYRMSGILFSVCP